MKRVAKRPTRQGGPLDPPAVPVPSRPGIPDISLDKVEASYAEILAEVQALRQTVADLVVLLRTMPTPSVTFPSYRVEGFVLRPDRGA
jgi:hypothetical protein